ncbi:MAG: hypothetical protein M1831_001390 [Alyxoria varia]|nr:MAG: hypothetical protein M1831_001390 [Alyxoria varia]
MDLHSASKENVLPSNGSTSGQKAIERYESHKDSLTRGKPTFFQAYDDTRNIDDILNTNQEVKSGHATPWMVNSPQRPKFKVRNVKRSTDSHDADWSGTRQPTKSPSATKTKSSLANRKTLLRTSSPHKTVPTVWTRESFNRLTNGSLQEGPSPNNFKHRTTRENKATTSSPTVDPKSAPSTIKTKGEANMTKEIACPLEVENIQSENEQQANPESLESTMGPEDVEEALRCAEQATSAKYMPQIEKLKCDLEVERSQKADARRQFKEKDCELRVLRQTIYRDKRMRQVQENRDRLCNDYQTAENLYNVRVGEKNDLINNLKRDLTASQANTFQRARESTKKSEVINDLQKNLTELQAQSVESSRLQSKRDAERSKREGDLLRMLETRTQEVERLKSSLKSLQHPLDAIPKNNDEVLKHCSELYQRARSTSETLDDTIMCVQKALHILQAEVFQFTQHRTVKSNLKLHKEPAQFALATTSLNFADILEITTGFFQDVNSRNPVSLARIPKLVGALKCMDIINDPEGPIMPKPEAVNGPGGEGKSTIKTQDHQSGFSHQNQEHPHQSEHKQKTQQKFEESYEPLTDGQDEEYDINADESQHSREELPNAPGTSSNNVPATYYGFDTAEFPPEFDQVLRDEVVSRGWDMTILAKMVRSGFITWQGVVDRMYKNGLSRSVEGKSQEYSYWGNSAQGGSTGSASLSTDSESAKSREGSREENPDHGGPTHPVIEADTYLSESEDEDDKSQESSDWGDPDHGGPTRSGSETDVYSSESEKEGDKNQVWRNNYRREEHTKCWNGLGRTTRVRTDVGPLVWVRRSGAISEPTTRPASDPLPPPLDGDAGDAHGSNRGEPVSRAPAGLASSERSGENLYDADTEGSMAEI